jgi:rare lipoprotein A
VGRGRRGRAGLALLALAALLAPGCAPLLDRLPGGRAARDGPRHHQVGIASWYDPGRRTVRGVRYDGGDLTAAHRTLPYGTLVRVTNLENGRSVAVVVNDRGPFVRGRVIDVSVPAARRLGIVRRGLARVRLEVLRRGGAAAGEA